MNDRFSKIECPKCEWKPDGGKWWQCHCSHVWNTFETQAKCPSCGYVHKWTQCPSCHVQSPHPDWYKDWGGLEEVEEVLQHVEK